MHKHWTGVKIREKKDGSRMCAVKNNGLKEKDIFFICYYFYATSLWNTANKTREEYAISTNDIAK